MKTPHKHAEDNSANKKKPHIHAELIKQWADGAQIQWYNNVTDEWVETSKVSSPCWDSTTQYRVKPEPKPDRIETRKLTYDPVYRSINYIPNVVPNIMFVFNGETNELKDVQLLASE